MARHRSPRGRRAHLPHTAGGGAHRSVPAPLRRGAAVVAVAGGALSIMGSAAPMPAVAAEVVLEPSVVPVVPVPEVLDASRLVAAVQLTERQVRAAEARKAAEKARASVDCGLDTSGLGGVTRAARAAAEFLGCRFGEPTMYGVAGRGGASDHPSGKAVDFMVGRATGDALAACALDNMDALGITYVIWRQRINYGDGWQAMEDRGDATANHMDHVHLSFRSGAAGRPTPC